MRSIGWTKQYMADWDVNVLRSKDAAEMRANVLKQYSGLGMEFTLNDPTATYSRRNRRTGKNSAHAEDGTGAAPAA